MREGDETKTEGEERKGTCVVRVTTESRKGEERRRTWWE